MSELSMWVIYERPRDYPDRFVVRWWVIRDDGPQPMSAVIVGSLEEARAKLPPGLVCRPRDEADEPQIVETWL